MDNDVKHEDQPEDDPKQYKGPPPGRLFASTLLIAVIVIVVLTTGLVLGHDLIVKRQTSQLAERAQQGRNVLVAKVFQPPTSRTISLPATIHGYIEAAIYAKVSGYLKQIDVDKGDRVQRGQVVAILDTPDLDKQVADAKANYWLQSVTNTRELMLLRQGVIAQQEADTARATMLQAKATYEQLLAEQGYKNITATIDGIVTARYVDPGALIPQATTSASGTPIISVATLSPLRVYAEVPQSLALWVKNGDAATITTYELAGRQFKGTVIRHPEALDTASRTMLAEVDLQNTDRALMPGMYAKLDITVDAAATSGSMVRDDALVFRDGKTYVPVVRDGHLHLIAVKLGYDNGQLVVVEGDIHDDDLVALNVGQAAEDNEVVHPVYAQK
ncbi:MAG TPA: efflux RND transporter periplasmic adaptor subunit [Candidatus Binataceae bacterium]|nr:efflux RND transporter periplasmic adaptor subunit [Candidatus Binataceae bacterium]